MMKDVQFSIPKNMEKCVTGIKNNLFNTFIVTHCKGSISLEKCKIFQRAVSYGSPTDKYCSKEIQDL